MSHINRGICLRRKRDVHAALRDFEQGVEIYTRLVDIDGRGELSPELARSHRHRGMARRNQGYAQGAMADLEKAIELLTRLVERENHRELAPELAKFLSETAWIYATSLDRSFRNGKKAHRFALQACELTEWKALFPVRALAAAHAETGNFAEAIKWQEKAVDLAPENNRGTLRSTLELFRAGQPLREPAAQDSAHP
jgi:serine/threonine-protein kinase